jgi:hypothetical protein
MSKRGNPNLVAGVSGNPAGRPLGSRNRLTNALVADLTASWEKHGPAVLERLRIDDPATYARLAVSLVPKDVQLTVEKVDPILEKLDADARAVLRELLLIIADTRAEGIEPATIFAWIAEDLRARMATEIEGFGSKAVATALSSNDKQESGQ